jgi:hypothetical protein
MTDYDPLDPTPWTEAQIRELYRLGHGGEEPPEDMTMADIIAELIDRTQARLAVALAPLAASAPDRAPSPVEVVLMYVLDPREGGRRLHALSAAEEMCRAALLEDLRRQMGEQGDPPPQE